MIISNSHEFAFVHIPKTGGTSITYALDETIEWNDIVCGGTPYGQRFKEAWGRKWGVGKHARASEIRALVGDDIWRNYFTFTVVRHPVDRVKSMYRWTERIVKEQGWRRWARFLFPRYRGDMWTWPTVQAYLETSSFSGYLKHPKLRDDLIVSSQYEFISDQSNGEIIVDRAFKLESIDNQFEALCQKIGIDAGLPEKNVSSGSRDVDVSSEDVEFIESAYERDFVALGYESRLSS